MRRADQITRTPPHVKARMGFGRTFQNVGMVKSATALENLRTAQHAKAGYDVLSVFSSTLVVADLLAKGYPGTVMVDSAGNNGPGYGSVGAPNTSPFSISVGATTNNVHLQYGPFANITRFGQSAAAYDDVAELSSRGPGIFGDPKPELMAVGSYGFTPADVTVKVLQAKMTTPTTTARLRSLAAPAWQRRWWPEPPRSWWGT